jgi:hypothetical protein
MGASRSARRERSGPAPQQPLVQRTSANPQSLPLPPPPKKDLTVKGLKYKQSTSQKRSVLSGHTQSPDIPSDWKQSEISDVSLQAPRADLQHIYHSSLPKSATNNSRALAANPIQSTRATGTSGLETGSIHGSSSSKSRCHAQPDTIDCRKVRPVLTY